MTYLALRVCAVWGVLERTLERTGAVAAPQELPDLACERLDIGGGDGGHRGREGAEVKVGGGVGVERIDVDDAPVDVGHGGMLRRGELRGRDKADRVVSIRGVAGVQLQAVAVTEALRSWVEVACGGLGKLSVGCCQDVEPAPELLQPTAVPQHVTQARVGALLRLETDRSTTAAAESLSMAGVWRSAASRVRRDYESAAACNDTDATRRDEARRFGVMMGQL